MATNEAKHSSLSDSVNTTLQKNNNGSPKTTFLTLKTAPLSNLIPQKLDAGISLRPAAAKLHPNLRNLAVALTLYLGVGTLCFYPFLDDLKGKKQSPLIDALYFTVVTMTTVGYGDLSPDTTFVKMLCCVFVITGMALVGLIMSKAADYILDKQEMFVIKALNKQQKYGSFQVIKEIETKKTSYKCVLTIAVLVILMLIATIFLYVVEDLDFIDCVYCVCTTITTLGYGDKAFSTKSGRLFASIWILTSTVGLGQFFMYLTEEFVDTRQKALASWILTRGMKNLNQDTNRVAEFAVNKLKEVGKISQDDVTNLMKEFEDLDVSRCGFLSASDLVFQKR